MTNPCKGQWIRKQVHGIDTCIELENKKKVRAINLDNAATTPAFKDVVCQVTEELKHYGSIGRGKGQKSEHATEVYTKGRDKIKAFVGADSADYTVIYVNNTTDGMNKLASALIASPDDLIITTRMEHHANDLPWRKRAQVLYAEVDANGRLLLSHLEQLLAANEGAVKYVTVTAASNVTGYVNDVHAIAKLSHRYGAKIIVDGAQIVAHRQFFMIGATEEENIDFFIFSAHKMYAPYGGGAIVGLQSVLNDHLPMFYGGGQVDLVCDDDEIYLEAPDSYEAGSPNYAGVVGLLAAIDMLNFISFPYIETHEQQLLQRVIIGLKAIDGVILYGDNDHFADRVGIVVFNITGYSAEETATLLSHQFGIATRHAAFCAHPYVRRLAGTAPDTECSPNHLVRISFGCYTSMEEIDNFLLAVRYIADCDHCQETAEAIIADRILATAAKPTGWA